jgi:hypothetical protein
MNIISCKEAKLQNLVRYFTGKPCKHGHIDERLVSNGTCCECNRLHVSKWQKENPQKALKNYRIWQAKNPSMDIIRSRTWYKNNKNRAANARKAYLDANPGLRAALSSKARADKLQRTPKWLTQDHKTHIKSHYELAKFCAKELGGEWHVDHIVPLRGDTVSGLHVPWNLQVLPKIDNLKKGNSHAS